MQKGKNANYQNENLIYKLLSIDDMEKQLNRSIFSLENRQRGNNMYEVKSVRVYEKKDFEKLAEILKTIERPLDTEVSNARFMCEDIASAMRLDDGIVVKESNGTTVATYEHNAL